MTRPRLYGKDIGEEERKTLGLTEKQLAFRHREKLHKQAAAAGIRAGDIVLGFDGRAIETTAYKFEHFVRKNYVIGERVTVNIIRDGERLDRKMTLGR